MLEFELDLSDIDEADAERSSNVPVGWYRCRVHDVQEDKKEPDITVFQFVVESGPFRKSFIFDRLYNPDTASDADKAKAMKSRMAMYAKRLGLIDSTAFGRRVAMAWTRAIGRECYVHVKEHEYVDRDTGEKKRTTKVDFSGVHALADERVPEDVRKRYGTVPASNGQHVAPPRGGTVNLPANWEPSRKDDFGDL
jgi:hypothetical protein